MLLKQNKELVRNLAFPAGLRGPFYTSYFLRH